MATARGPSRKHVVIFSRKCLFLDSKEKQQQLNAEIDELAKSDQFDLYFTSHETPTAGMSAAIPER